MSKSKKAETSYYNDEGESEYESEVPKKSTGGRSKRTAGVVSQGLQNNKFIDDRPVPVRRAPA